MTQADFFVDDMGADEVAARLTEFSVGALAALITRANREYWDDAAPTLPDTLYDRLVERLRREAPDHDVLTAMGPSATGEGIDDAALRDTPPADRIGRSVRHTVPMLSLDKGYGEEALTKWFEKFEGDLLVMPKLDGMACSLRYAADGSLLAAVTRGSGTDGEDITHNMLAVPGVPARIDPAHAPLEVRGEVFMPLSEFVAYRDEYANPRNLTAGTIKQKDSQKRVGSLRLGAYDVLVDLADEAEKMALLGQLGFPTVDFEIVARPDAQAAFERMAARRAELDYEIDGVVFRASLTREQRRLGATAHHPRYALAYKFQGDTGETTLRDVLWSVSRTGTITPVSLLEPVELSGAMIGRAGLHNLNRFRELDLRVGCRVEVTRRGGVIPHVERVLERDDGADPFAIPTECPACGGPVGVRQKRDGEFLVCERPDSCVPVILRALEHFAKIIDMQGFGPKVIASAAEAGLLATPADFYGLRAGDLEELDRLGAKSAQNLVDQVDAHRQIPLPTFLESLGIDHLGTQNAIVVANATGSLTQARAVTLEQLTAIKGVKEAIATAIVDGLAAKSELIDALLAAGVEVLDHEAPPEPEGDAPLAGQSFVFTGALEAFERKTAQARVKALGGDTPSGVSKALTYLVIGAGKGATSSKQKKAETLIEGGAPIRILDEDEFLALLEPLEAPP